MQQRRRVPQTPSLDERLIRDSQNLRKQAEGMPACVARDDLLRKARQAETRVSRVLKWLSSPGLATAEVDALGDLHGYASCAVGASPPFPRCSEGPCTWQAKAKTLEKAGLALLRTTSLTVPCLRVSAPADHCHRRIRLPCYARSREGRFGICQTRQTRHEAWSATSLSSIYASRIRLMTMRLRVRVDPWRYPFAESTEPAGAGSGRECRPDRCRRTGESCTTS